MRPLKEEEITLLFSKLSEYIGDNIKKLIEREDGTYVFRLHKAKVFYVKEDILRLAVSFGKDALASFGTCIGKFTKSGKFVLTITALDILAKFALYKLWIKPGSEMGFLYGGDIRKTSLGRISDSTPQFQGLVVMTMTELPVGFGRASKSTIDTRKAGPEEIVCFHQEDVGMYLRDEQNLV